MNKPTKAECLKWAADCDTQAERYRLHAHDCKERGDIAHANFWADSALTRVHEANTLRAYAAGL